MSRVISVVLFLFIMTGFVLAADAAPQEIERAEHSGLKKTVQHAVWSVGEGLMNAGRGLMKGFRGLMRVEIRPLRSMRISSETWMRPGKGLMRSGLRMMMRGKQVMKENREKIKRSQETMKRS